jgi:acetyl-CoA carboxylase biotin carboxyl carrier protein
MADTKVVSEIAGSVWKVLVNVGDTVAADAPVAILESMKMEIPVLAPEDGVITAVHVSEGSAIAEGDLIATLRT